MNAGSFESSAVVGVIDTLILLLLLNFKLVLLNFHNFFRGHNFGIGLVILLLDSFHLFSVLGFELVEFNIVHLSDGTELVSLIGLDALGLEICTYLLMNQFRDSRVWVDYFHDLKVRVNILIASGCKLI